LEELLKKIKSGGLKVTPRRKAIIELFSRTKCHLTPDDVWRSLKKQFTQCGLPSVYRNLESLVECRVLTRIQLFDSKKHYVLCTSQHKHHHHIVCIKCGKVEEMQECTFSEQEEINGYRIVDHFMQVNGICANCH
jgi:Fe2+ or Zn2+ uptake regulation protein